MIFIPLFALLYLLGPKVWSSRPAHFWASPSSDPGVRLFRTGLLAKLMHHALSVYADVDFRLCKRIFS